MDKEIMHMLDTKATAGTIATAMTASSGSWIDTAEPIVTMVATILVGGVTLWYTVERALKLRKERKDGDTKGGESGGSSGGNGGSVGDSKGR